MKAHNLHIAISVLLYMACLVLPAYYVGERSEPQAAHEALAAGWIGPVDLHFSWYANLFFFLALLTAKRPLRSSILAFIGLALAASFLLHKSIAVSEAPTYKPIVAYGWGYGLWIASLATLAVGQLLRHRDVEARRLVMVSLSTSVLLVAAFGAYYFVGDNSLSALRAARDREFLRLCASSGEQIYKRTSDVRGIFFDPDWEQGIGSRSPNSSFKQILGVGRVGHGHLYSGHLLFYEIRDTADATGYVKYIVGDHKGARSKQLESEYAVITTFHQDAKLNISGATVTVEDRRDNSKVATVTYFIENEAGRFCGSPRAHFSTSRFITEVLGLTAKYPSPAK